MCQSPPNFFPRAHRHRALWRGGWLIGLIVLLIGVSLLPGSAAAGRPGLTVLETGRDSLTLSLFVPGAELQPSREQPGAIRVEARGLNSGRTGQPGQPSLPATSVLVAVPPQATVRLRIREQSPGQKFAARPWETVPFESPRPADPARGIDQSSDLSRDAVGTMKQYRTPDQATLVAAANAYQAVRIVDQGYLRDQRFVRLLFQPFEPMADGSLLLHNTIQAELVFEGPIPPSDTAPPSDPYFEPVYRRSLINYQQGRAWRLIKPQRDSAAGADIPPQRLRIVTAADGIYSLGYDDLQQAGLNLAKIDARTLALSSRGQPVAVIVQGEEDGRFDPGDHLLFYGQQSNSRYSHERVYWLSWGQSPGLRMATADASVALGGVPTDVYTETVHVEQNNIYLSSDPPNGEADRWYWDRYTVGGRTEIPTLSSQIPTHDVVAGRQAQLTVAVRGFTSFFAVNPDHHLQFSINGQPVGSGAWDGQDLLQQSYTFSSDLLTGSNDSFSLFAPNDTGASTDTGYLDWFELRYVRRLQAHDDRLAFGTTAQGRLLYQLTGFSQSGLELYDISDPAQPLRLLGASEQAGGSVQFSVEGTGDNRYLVQHPGRRLSPLRIEADYLSDYRTPDHQADYLIISPAEFMDAILPLAQYRMSQGYKVLMIDVQDIYDEFNHGELSPAAIRDFIDYAYHNWQTPHPAFVLLVGDGSYDYLDYLGYGAANWMPPLLEVVDPFLRETATDNRLVTVSGADNLPDLFIGRFPARTAAQVSTMVNKTIQYETAPWPGDWTLRNLFVADNADTAGDFAYLSDLVADHLPAPYDAHEQKIYLGVNYSSSTAARQDIRSAFDEGALLTNYVGHGQVTFWASEFIFRAEDAASLSNGGRLPVHLSLTCLDGRFQEPDRDSVAESLVLNANGGAAATWAATGLGVAHGHDYMHQGFYNTLFAGGDATLGALIIAGKINLYTGDTLGVYHDLIDTFHLMGDPALHLNLTPTDLALELLEAPSGEKAPGDLVRLRFRIRNLGQVTAPGVYVDVDLPALANLSATADLGPVQIIPGNPTRFVLGDLDVGASTELEIQGTMPEQMASSAYPMWATVASAWREDNLENNTIDDISLRVATTDVGVTMASDPPRALAPGEAFTLQISYQNNGPALATGATITLSLPAGISGLSWLASDPAITQTASSPLSFDLPDLPQYAAGSISIQAHAGSTVQRAWLQAHIRSAWVDGNLANNDSAPISYAVAAPDAGEPNDQRQTATPLPVPGRLPDRSYERAGDVDWYSFNAEAGVNYRFYTANLTEGGDTLLILYTETGQEIMRNDDVGPGVPWSSLSWQPKTSGFYYLSVSHPQNGSTPFLYDLVAERGFDNFMPLLLSFWRPPTPTPTFTPTPKPTPTPTLTPTPKPTRPLPTPSVTPTPTLTPTPPVGQCLPSIYTTIALEGAPRSLQAAEKRVLAANAESDTVAVVDSQSIELVASHVAGGRTPAGLAIWRSFYYVSHQLDGTVSMFDLAGDQLLNTFATISQPAALAVTDESLLYVTSKTTAKLAVHYADSGKLRRTLMLSGRPNQLLALGNTVWETVADGPYGLVAIDSAGALLTPIPGVPAGALAMAADHTSGLLYVGHPAQQRIFVIDTVGRVLLHSYALGFAPSGLALDTINHQLLAVDATANQLVVLDVQQGAEIGRLPLGRQGADGGLGIVYLDGHIFVANALDHSLSVFAAPPCQQY